MERKWSRGVVRGEEGVGVGGGVGVEGWEAGRGGGRGCELPGPSSGLGSGFSKASEEGRE